MVKNRASASQAATQTGCGGSCGSPNNRRQKLGDRNGHIYWDLTVSLAVLLDGWSGLEAKMSIKEINNPLHTKRETAQSDSKWKTSGAVQHERERDGNEAVRQDIWLVFST